MARGIKYRHDPTDFTHTPRWINLRESILRRDAYKCQNCLKSGKFEQAEIVHHIFPKEQYIEYAYEPWNLISLCHKCHNGMHDRFTGELSKAGKSLLKTTALIQGIDIPMQDKTILVCGLRGHGKSTYVKEHLDMYSIAYDLDAIASAFRLNLPHEEYFKPARRMANDFLSGFIAKAHDYCSTVYIIRTAPSIKEFEQIMPDSVVFCEHEYVYRDMQDRDGAIKRLESLKNFVNCQNIPHICV